MGRKLVYYAVVIMSPCVHWWPKVFPFIVLFIISKTLVCLEVKPIINPKSFLCHINIYIKFSNKSCYRSQEATK